MDTPYLRGGEKKGKKKPNVSVLYEKRLTKVRYIVEHKTTANKTECNKAQG